VQLVDGEQMAVNKFEREGHNKEAMMLTFGLLGGGPIDTVLFHANQSPFADLDKLKREARRVHSSERLAGLWLPAVLRGTGKVCTPLSQSNGASSYLLYSEHGSLLCHQEGP
jgi:hypothetical protein